MQDGSWPLHLAIEHNRVEVVQILVQRHGALHEATRRGDVDLMVKLIDKFGMSPQLCFVSIYMYVLS